MRNGLDPQALPARWHREAIFHAAGARLMNSMLGRAAKLAQGVGVTPWTLLAQLARLFQRGFENGGVAVWKLGPKEARAETAALPLLRIPYFRRGLGGVLQTQLSLFCMRVFVSDSDPRPSDAVSYRVSWA